MKQPFGRGLESLIPKKSGKISEESETKQEPIFYIELEKIKSNPYQPRKNFNQEGLQALADSIKEYGILQPLLVSRIEKESGTEYQLVAGERRFLAAKTIGLTQVPVIVRDPTEQEKLEVSLVENVQRMDLNAMEKAEAYYRLQKEFNFLQKDIGKLCGKSREAVANTLRLLDLPEEIKRALREEKISEGHARAILAVSSPEKQKAVLVQTIRDGLNVREVESLAQKLSIWQPVKRHVPGTSKEIKELENKFRDILGIKEIKLTIIAQKPKLSIFFDSKKEVEKFLEDNIKKA
ncbi:MAG: ParB/RepB/Spo0J family partition protein [Candidatus Nealsonbacteria bacterium]|nr:ParB/RepB/Spo0J family partition protein [Candidatus Nealsonbacteria bacterium]